MCKFHYYNLMDIKNLLNYLEKQIVAYTLNVDNVIKDQF